MSCDLFPNSTYNCFSDFNRCSGCEYGRSQKTGAGFNPLDPVVALSDSAAEAARAAARGLSGAGESVGQGIGKGLAGVGEAIGEGLKNVLSGSGKKGKPSPPSSSSSSSGGLSGAIGAIVLVVGGVGAYNLVTNGISDARDRASAAMLMKDFSAANAVRERALNEPTAEMKALDKRWFKNDLLEKPYPDGRYKGDADFLYWGDRSGMGYFHGNDGSAYFGGWKDDQRSGKGIMESPRARFTHYNQTAEFFRYSGDFLKDLPHGRGVKTHFRESFTFANGGKFILQTLETYDGDFKFGEKTGQAVIVKPDGVQYEGAVVNGVYEGHGHLVTPTIDYTGDFKGGIYDGSGHLITAAIDYEGGFQNGAYEGAGTMTYPDGNELYAIFTGGVAENYGSIVTKDSKIYRGGLKDGEPHGIGALDGVEGLWSNGCLKGGTQTMSVTPGKSCSGYFEAGEAINIQPVGQSKYMKEIRTSSDHYTPKYVSPKGYVWEGEVDPKTKLPQGYGVLHYSENTMAYEGNITTDSHTGEVEFHGFGVIYYPNGGKKIAQFDRGRMSGDFIEMFSNGSRLQTQSQVTYEADEKGNQVGGVREIRTGWGIYVVGGCSYTGLFRDSAQHGAGVYQCQNGYKATGTWLNGQLSGQADIVYSEGSHYVGAMANGKRNGYGEMYYNNDIQVQYKGNWADDKPNGYGITSWMIGIFGWAQAEGNWSNGCLRAPAGHGWRVIENTRAGCGFEPN